MIVVGICSGGEIKADTVTSILQCSNIPPDKTFCFATGGYVHKNREIVANQGIKMNASHVMFIDHDMLFPANGIQRLLEQDKEIIGANYNTRAYPPTCTIKIADKDGHFVNFPRESIPRETFECAALGTGFMLINTAVFKKMQKPYFFFADFDGEEMTEDVYFCNKARDNGIKVWCDPTIPITHVGTFNY